MNRKKKLRRLFASLGLGAMALGTPAFARFEGEGDAGGGAGDAGGETGAEGGETGGETGGAKDEVIPKAKYDEVLKESMARKKELQALNGKIKELEANAVTKEDREELAKLREERAKAEEENKKKRGEFESLTEKMKKDAAEREAKLAAERDTYKGKYQGERIRNALATAIPKFTTAGTDDLQELLQKKISVDPETDALVIEGEPVNPKTGKEYTIEEWVEAEIERRPHFAAHKPSGGSGGSSQRGAGGKKGKEPTPDEINKMTHAEFKEWEKSQLAGSR